MLVHEYLLAFECFVYLFQPIWLEILTVVCFELQIKILFSTLFSKGTKYQLFIHFVHSNIFHFIVVAFFLLSSYFLHFFNLYISLFFCFIQQLCFFFFFHFGHLLFAFQRRYFWFSILFSFNLILLLYDYGNCKYVGFRKYACARVCVCVCC